MFSHTERRSWNFTEAGHGKGPMDGVGGVLKRKGDNLVAYGEDFSSVEEFIEKLSVACPSIALIEIREESFEKIKSLSREKVDSTPQVTLMHQAVWHSSTPDTLYLRELSCLECRKICKHHKHGNGFIKFTSPKKSLDNSKNVKESSAKIQKRKAPTDEQKKNQARSKRPRLNRILFYTNLCLK